MLSPEVAIDLALGYMIEFELGVADLAAVRFAYSPLHEVVLSLRLMNDPGLGPIHLPWTRRLPGRLAGSGVDTALLVAMVSRTRTIPDFLSPRPAVFSAPIEEELAMVARTPPERVRRDIRTTHIRNPFPARVSSVPTDSPEALSSLRDELCDQLFRYWRATLEQPWPRMRLLLEADITHRARRLALEGAGGLFADIHPDLEWQDGVLRIHRMVSHHTVDGGGRGLLLVPSVFAHKPAPPAGPEEPPMVVYPCRAAATMWEAPDAADPDALDALVGTPRAHLLRLLTDPLPTVELARRLRVTPSAVSQHLRVLAGSGLVTRARHGRMVLYRRTSLGDQLISPDAG